MKKNLSLLFLTKVERNSQQTGSKVKMHKQLIEVKNTGSHPITVTIIKDGKPWTGEQDPITIQPNKVATIPVDVFNNRTIAVKSNGGPSSVEVSANAVIKWYEDGRSRNVAVTAPTQKAGLEFSVDVLKKPVEALNLVSVTPEDKNGNGTPEQFVFKFNTAVSGAEAGDFRLDGVFSRAASAVELRDDNKEVVVKFAESDVSSSATINYDGSFINGDVVIKDGFGNKVKPFNVSKAGL